MGDLKSVASMIPGVGKAIKDMDIDENVFKSTEAVIDSMTPTNAHTPIVSTKAVVAAWLQAPEFPIRKSTASSNASTICAR